MDLHINDLIEKRTGENFELHSRYMNHQFVKVLETIGFDKVYTRAMGQYLYDADDNRYLDLLSGFGVYLYGRNHPKIISALKETLDSQLANLVQMDCPLLAGLLAEALVKKTRAVPHLAHLSKVAFCNSGAEAVEVAVKFARAATGRDRIIYCKSAYHGLTNGALSLNGDKYFKKRFGSLLPECHEVPFDDLAALEAALHANNTACFIVEPIQGKSLRVASDGYFSEATRLCRKHGALLIMDEVQTGLGRTGKFFASEHWQAEPDIITLSKGLSGGFIPVGAVVFRENVFKKVFDNVENAAVHMSTFAANNMAMAASLASLSVIDEENLVEKAAKNGERLIQKLRTRLGHHEFFKEVRGKGMMIGIELGEPRSLSRRATWHFIDKINKGLFCQMVIMPLLAKHRILTQVAGHDSYTVKLLPPLMITEEDIEWTVDAFDQVLAEVHRIAGPMWNLATNYASA